MDTPVLSEINQLKLQNMILRAEVISNQLDKIKAEASVLITSLQIDGFALNIETLCYVPKVA